MTDTPAAQLFPEIQPFATHMLPVGNGHTLYIEQSGNPAGLPVIVLHGGPGSGSKPKHRQFFDPAIYHIIIFDQRGCGLSTPSGLTEANTTAHLVQDIETIRTNLGIEQWVVYGNSWGSTLAVAYAETHPHAVLGLIIGAIFTGTAAELDWLYNPGGLARFFPQEYANLLHVLGNPTYTELPHAIHKAVMQDDTHAYAVARAVSLLDLVSMDLVPDVAALTEFLNSPEFSLTPVRIWSHYFANNCFLKPQELLTNASRIAHLPIHILQAGLDLCCPPATAVALHQSLPGSQYTSIHLCGHRATPEMDQARLNAIAAMAQRLLG